MTESVIQLQRQLARANERIRGLEQVLKEAQEQPAACSIEVHIASGYEGVKWISSQYKDGIHHFYALPAPAQPAVELPAPEQSEGGLAVPEEWREVLTELADDLSIELDMRYQSRSHYPSEIRKYENEMQPVYRARALLQSVEETK